MERTCKGIIYIDEIDKVSRKSENLQSQDVWGKGSTGTAEDPRRNCCNVPPKGGESIQQEFLQIDTTNILFICGGAFVGLERIVENRLGQQAMGFSQSKDSKHEFTRNELLARVEAEDLMRFGLIPEFIGRVPVVATLDELDESALVMILTVPKNALVKQYQKLFEMESVKLKFTDGALRQVAQEALSRKAGARGLRAILESDVGCHVISSRENVKMHYFEVVQNKAEPMLVYSEAEWHSSKRLRDGCFLKIRRILQNPSSSRCRREIVVFPYAPISLIVGRERSVAAVKAANQNGGQIFLVTQRRGDQLEPTTNELYTFSTIAHRQTLHLPDGNMKILVEGVVGHKSCDMWTVPSILKWKWRPLYPAQRVRFRRWCVQ